MFLACLPWKTRRRWTGAGTAILLAAGVFGLGGLSVRAGQDLNFDLLNYHYYAGWAFLHGRLDRDIVPAGQQTFQAPLVHVPHYLGIAHLPPRLFGFLLGAAHGLNLPLLFALAMAVLPRENPDRARVLAFLAAAAGSLGPLAVSLLGTTFADNLVSIPALAALVLVMRVGNSEEHGTGDVLTTVAAGLLAGVATGLKLTMAVFHLALLAAAVEAWRSSGQVAKRLALLAAGSVAGFTATGGFWYWKIAERFANPVFPFANAFFRSPYHSLENFRDTRWMAHGVFDYIRPLFDLALGRSERVSEVAMRDVRFLLLLAVAAIWALLRLAARVRGTRVRLAAPPGLNHRQAAVAVYWLTAYALWACSFYTYRYMALLEFTAPLLLLIVLTRLVPARFWIPAAVLLTLVVVTTSRTNSWGRRAWQTPWLALPVPAFGLQPDSLVLMVGQPSAFAAPSFRDDARFVNLTAVERFKAPARWEPLVAQAVARHRGPLLLLSNFEFSRAECDARVAALGLRPTSRCEHVRNGSLRFRLCELERAPGGGLRDGGVGGNDVDIHARHGPPGTPRTAFR